MNTSIDNSNATDSKITATIVPEHYRLGFLPRHFGNLMLVVESAVYDHMRSLATDYAAGYWQFVDLSNGGCFLHPTQKSIHIVAPNGFEGTVSGEVAGIIATLYALSHLSFEHREADCLSNGFHELREFALEHSHCGDILAAVD